MANKLILFMGVAMALLLPSAARTESLSQTAVKSSQVQTLELVVGKSKVIDTPVPIKRASLANPDVADTVVLSPTQIYLTGKAVGVTNLTFWQENGQILTIFDVVVSADLNRLKEQLQRLLPNERDIRVTADHDHVTLAGAVSSTAIVTKVREIAEAYAPKKVINLLQVGGVQQIMLEVRVAEMNRELTRRLGINFNYIDNNAFGVSALGNLTALGGGGSSAGQVTQTVTSVINALFGFRTGNVTWTTFIDALKDQNLLKILAKPTLVTLSGQDAQFLAGGEFPFPVPQSLGTVTIEFKKFGVGLSFHPTVLSSNHISMTVAPEVSELDFTNSVTIGGFRIPAITTRRASTVIELADGQSFAIAGLLQDTVREDIAKFPVLGDIPILGALFRSSSFRKRETELVIIVTPHLVKPLDLVKQTLPTDSYLEPNDFEFYLMGYTEGLTHRGGPVDPSASTGVTASGPGRPGRPGQMEGVFGHLAP